MPGTGDNYYQAPETEDEEQGANELGNEQIGRHAHLLASAMPFAQLGKLKPGINQAGQDGANKTISDLDREADESSDKNKEILAREKALSRMELENPIDFLSLAIRHSYLAEQYYNLSTINANKEPHAKKDPANLNKEPIANKKLDADKEQPNQAQVKMSEGQEKKGEEHFEKAKFYWQSTLTKMIKGGATQSIEDTKIELANLDRELNEFWPRRSPQPSGNPIAAALYERMAEKLLAQYPISNDNLTEASKYFQKSIHSLIQYDERFGGKKVEQKEIDLIEKTFEIECKLTAKTRGTTEYREHLLNASDLLGELVEIENKHEPGSGKLDQYGKYDSSFIPVLKDIAKLQAKKDDGDPVAIKREGDPNRIAIKALERVKALQTSLGSSKEERIKTLQELAREYFAISKFDGLRTYISTVQLATKDNSFAKLTQEDMSLLLMLEPPKGSLEYIKNLPILDKNFGPQGYLNKEERGEYVFEFSKAIKTLADLQSSDRRTNDPALDNYILATAASKMALNYFDGRRFNSRNLLDLLNSTDKLTDIDKLKNLARDRAMGFNVDGKVPIIHTSRPLEDEIKDLYEAAFNFADKQYNNQDIGLEPLLTKIADFHISHSQFSEASKVLTKYLTVVREKLGNIDDIAKLSKLTDISKQLALVQSKSSNNWDATLTAGDSLNRIRQFFKSKDSPETLEALHLYADYLYKQTKAIPEISHPVRDIKREINKKITLNIKEEEIDMTQRMVKAGELKISEADMNKLLKEKKAIMDIK